MLTVKLACYSLGRNQDLKWDAIEVDVVAEATGLFLTDEETARKHICWR